MKASNRKFNEFAVGILDTNHAYRSSRNILTVITEVKEDFYKLFVFKQYYIIFFIHFRHGKGISEAHVHQENGNKSLQI